MTMPKRLLIVDDDLMIRKAMTRALQGRFISIETARDGFEALRMLADGNLYDAIISDVDMPTCDGITFFKAIQAKYPAMLDHFVFHTGSPEHVMALHPSVVVKADYKHLFRILDQFASSP